MSSFSIWSLKNTGAYAYSFFNILILHSSKEATCFSKLSIRDFSSLFSSFNASISNKSLPISEDDDDSDFEITGGDMNLYDSKLDEVDELISMIV